MMSLGDSVTALERENEHLRKDRDGWRDLAERLQGELDEAIRLLEEDRRAMGNGEGK